MPKSQKESRASSACPRESSRCESDGGERTWLENERGAWNLTQRPDIRSIVDLPKSFAVTSQNAKWEYNDDEELGYDHAARFAWFKK